MKRRPTSHDIKHSRGAKLFIIIDFVLKWDLCGDNDLIAFIFFVIKQNVSVLFSNPDRGHSRLIYRWRRFNQADVLNPASKCGGFTRWCYPPMFVCLSVRSSVANFFLMEFGVQRAGASRIVSATLARTGPTSAWLVAETNGRHLSVYSVGTLGPFADRLEMTSDVPRRL